MWVTNLPWDSISQSAFSEAIGSLAATGLVTGGSWLIRCARRRHRSKTAMVAAASMPPVAVRDGQADA
ncbi:hypothetical protein [Streptomyces platensis]|uniref:hypothetical protein n=1 Tax=Streptomyces platensis TaxID=58346 RepID=UPI00331E0617